MRVECSLHSYAAANAGCQASFTSLELKGTKQFGERDQGRRSFLGKWLRKWGMAATENASCNIWPSQRRQSATQRKPPFLSNAPITFGSRSSGALLQTELV